MFCSLWKVKYFRNKKSRFLSLCWSLQPKNISWKFLKRFLLFCWSLFNTFENRFSVTLNLKNMQVDYQSRIKRYNFVRFPTSLLFKWKGRFSHSQTWSTPKSLWNLIKSRISNKICLINWLKNLVPNEVNNVFPILALKFNICLL